MVAILIRNGRWYSSCPISNCSYHYGSSLSLSQNSKSWYIKVRVNGCGGLFSLAPVSSCIMQTLFVETFLFCPKELRVCLRLMLAKFYLLKLPGQPGVKQLAKAGQPAAVKWYFWRKSWIGPARELQTAWVNPGCSPASQLLVHCLPGSWARTPERPLPTAQGGQREQWGLLISTCSLSQKRD